MFPESEFSGLDDRSDRNFEYICLTDKEHLQNRIRLRLVECIIQNVLFISEMFPRIPFVTLYESRMNLVSKVLAAGLGGEELISSHEQELERFNLWKEFPPQCAIIFEETNDEINRLIELKNGIEK